MFSLSPNESLKLMLVNIYCLPAKLREVMFSAMSVRQSFWSGADPGFPVGGGTNPPGGGRQHMILPNFAKNCMKLRKFWALGPPKTAIAGGGQKHVGCQAGGKHPTRILLVMQM